MKADEAIKAREMRRTVRDEVGASLESALLNVAIFDPKFLDDVDPLPEPDDFLKGWNGQVWAAILETRRTGLFSVTRLTEALAVRSFDLSSVQTILNRADDAFIDRIEARSAIDYLRHRSLARRARVVCNEFLTGLDDDHYHAAPAAVERLERQVADVARGADHADHWVFADNLKEQWSPTISTGWDSLDEITSGLPLGVLTVVAARPGMGKSAFAVQMARQLGLKGHGVGFFSLEMPARDLQDRMAAAHAYRPGVMYAGMSDNPYYSTARKGELTPAQQRRFDEALRAVKQLPIAFDERKGLPMSKIRIAARRLRSAMQSRGTPLAAIFVDHLQHIRPDIDRRGNRTQEVTDITGALMEMAAELEVAVVALSQLNRELTKRDDKRPTLADLRESGSIEQDAHTILLLHRPAYYFEQQRKAGEEVNSFDEQNARHDFEVNVAKQRNGPTERVQMFVEIGANAITDQRRQAREQAA